MKKPPALDGRHTEHSENSGTEVGDKGIELNEAFCDSSSSYEDDEQDIGDVDMEDLLDIEGDIPLDANDPPAYDSPYSSADWLGPRRSASAVSHDAATDFPAPLSLFGSLPSAEDAAKLAREERKRKVREEDQRMKSFGFKYVVTAESPGEYELCVHPYLSRYRVRQRSLLRNGWFLDKQNDAHRNEDERPQPR